MKTRETSWGGGGGGGIFRSRKCYFQNFGVYLIKVLSEPSLGYYFDYRYRKLSTSRVLYIGELLCAKRDLP